jgi:large conductance mechanosensitive channel
VLGILKKFKKFALRGNVVDMVVGIIIGVVFGTIIKSLVSDIIMLPIGLLLGNVDFANLFLVLKEGASTGPYTFLTDAQAAGAVTINYGIFLNTIISFIIIAFAIFLIIRKINKLKKQEEVPAEPTTKDYPYCLTSIPTFHKVLDAGKYIVVLLSTLWVPFNIHSCGFRIGILNSSYPFYH